MFLNLLRKYRKIFSDQSGITMIETAIVLPLFLVIILWLIWFALTINARNSLSAAVSSSVRLALTRGDSKRVANSSDIVTQINLWKETGLATDKLKSLLASPDILQIGDPLADNGWYIQSWEQTFGAYSLDQIPSYYPLAIIYAYEQIKANIGKVRYPCNPWVSNGINGAGCLRCTNLNPNSANICPTGMSWDPVTSLCTGTETSPSGFSSVGFNYAWVGVHCEYSSDNNLAAPISNLLSLIGAGSFSPKVITRTQYFRVNKVSDTVS